MASLLKHTVRPSGGDFTSLDACWDHLLASHADFVSADVYGEIEVGGDWSLSPDTAPVAAIGLTLDETRYLHIYPDAANYAGPSWDDDKYRLLVSNAVAVQKSGANTDYVRWEGLQVGVSAVNANYQAAFYIEYTTDSNALWWIYNCLIRGPGEVAYRAPGIMVTDSQMGLNIWNSIVYNFKGTEGARADSALYAYLQREINIYNSILSGGAYGLYLQDSGTVNAKNVYSYGGSIEGFYREGGTLNKVNCASDDGSADDTGVGETASNCLVGVAFDSDTFVDVGDGSEDFHLAEDGASPLQGVGYDNSGDSAPMNFTEDMDGDEMVNFSIGVDDGPGGAVGPAGGIGSGFVAGTSMMRGTIQSEV